MATTVAHLKPGQKGLITTIAIEALPIKLLELGCLPGNTVELLQIAPFRDPLYINLNGSHIAIRREMAAHIAVDLDAEIPEDHE